MQQEDGRNHRLSFKSEKQEGLITLFAAQDRQRAFDRMSAATAPRTDAIEHKRALVSEITERALLPLDVLREHPCVYPGSAYDIEYPLALGFRHLIMVDPILDEPNAVEKVKNRVRALTGDLTGRQQGGFSFIFDFGEGDERASIELVSKFYNPPPPLSFFRDAADFPANMLYVIPDETGMILGFQSHFDDIKRSDLQKLAHGGFVLNNKRLAGFPDIDYKQEGGASPIVMRDPFEAIRLTSERGSNYTFVRKK